MSIRRNPESGLYWLDGDNNFRTDIDQHNQDVYRNEEFNIRMLERLYGKGRSFRTALDSYMSRDEKARKDFIDRIDQQRPDVRKALTEVKHGPLYYEPPAKKPKPSTLQTGEKRKSEAPVESTEAKQVPDQVESPVQVNEVSSTSGASGTADVTMVEPQAGGGVPGGTGSSQMPHILHGDHNGKTVFQYSKCFQWETPGLQISRNAATFLDTHADRVNNSDVWSTGLACIDPNLLVHYMTQSEWDNLPPNTHAKSCEITVTPVGFRLPFATGESQASYANSQTLVQIYTAVGINKVFNTVQSGYMFNQTDLTKPTKINANTVAYNDWYGGDSGAGAVSGDPMAYPIYTSLIVPTASVSPILTDYVKIMNINDCKGVPIIHFTHTFKESVIKMGVNCPRDMLKNGQLLAEGFNNPSFAAMTGRASGNGSNVALYSGATSNQYNTPTGITYTTLIEKSTHMTSLNGNKHSPETVPTVNFGVMPVQSTPLFASTRKFSDVAAIWEVRTKLILEHTNQQTTTGLYTLPIGAWDPLFASRTQMPGFTNGLGPSLTIAGRRFGLTDTVYNANTRYQDVAAQPADEEPPVKKSKSKYFTVDNDTE
nr:MAG: VP1 [Lanius cristatus ambidensovirus]